MKSRRALAAVYMELQSYPVPTKGIHIYKHVDHPSFKNSYQLLIQHSKDITVKISKERASE